MWSIKYVNNKSSDLIGILTPKNHLMSNKNHTTTISQIFEEVGLVNSIGTREGQLTLEHDFISHEDELWIGKKICIFLYNQEVEYWLPVVEIKGFQEFISKYGEPEFGYIDGRLSHNGLLTNQDTIKQSEFVGYKLWLQTKKNN